MRTAALKFLLFTCIVLPSAASAASFECKLSTSYGLVETLRTASEAANSRTHALPNGDKFSVVVEFTGGDFPAAPYLMQGSTQLSVRIVDVTNFSPPAVPHDTFGKVRSLPGQEVEVSGLGATVYCRSAATE